MSSDSGKQLKGTATAQNFKQVYDAGTRYIKDNYGLLLASTPTVITTSMLVSAGYLTPTYSGLNPFAQSTSINITQPVANNLQAVVITSNGNAIPEAMAPVIVSKIGSSGAYFPVLTPNIAKGAFGGWSLDLTGTSTGAGHLAGLLFYNNGDLVSDYLQRHQVPGHPEVNEMFTAINMNSNDINSANNVNTANVNASSNVAANTFQVNGVSTAGQGCSPNGLVAQDGSGALLSCVSGVWTGYGGIGVGQTWQNVTYSRASGVSYFNNTGKPIQISITYPDTGGGTAFAGAIVNWVSVVPTVLYDIGTSTGSFSINLIIPNNSMYAAAGGPIAGWWELR